MQHQPHGEGADQDGSCRQGDGDDGVAGEGAEAQAPQSVEEEDMDQEDAEGRLGEGGAEPRRGAVPHPGEDPAAETRRHQGHPQVVAHEGVHIEGAVPQGEIHRAAVAPEEAQGEEGGPGLPVLRVCPEIPP